jgi:hypothetical protein
MNLNERVIRVRLVQLIPPAFVSALGNRVFLMASDAHMVRAALWSSTFR